MAAKDFLWDSQAAQRLADSEMTKHHAKNKKHYDALAKTSWDGLHEVSESPQLLKHGDLWDVLFPVITRDSTTIKGLEGKNLPVPTAYGGTRWAAWFTHYVAEDFLSTIHKEEGV